MKDEEYMDNIQVSAYIAIALDLLVGIGSFIFIWRTTSLRDMWRNSTFKLCGFTLCRYYYYYYTLLNTLSGFLVTVSFLQKNN